MPLTCMRRPGWGMLYAEDPNPKMMTASVAVFEAAGLPVSEQKSETMLLRTYGESGIRCSINRDRSS